MTMDITAMPEYGDAYAAFKVARKAAQDADDELALTKAEIAWERKQRELLDTAYARADVERRREAALTEAKAKYPRAPEKAYERLQDPEAILETAQQIHEGAEAAIKAATESWGAPNTGQTGGPPPRSDVDTRLRELVPSVRRGKAGEIDNEEFRRIIFREQIGNRFDFNLPPR